MCASAAHVHFIPTATTEKKAHRLVARVSRSEKKLFQHVMQQNTIRLNSQQSREFVEALLAPPRAPTAAMKRALKRYGRAVTEA